MRQSVDVLILGAGLSGLSVAYHLEDLSRLKTLVVEKEYIPGGTAGSVRRGGFVFDRTGHLLHLHDDYAKRQIRSWLRGNLTLMERRAWVRLQGRYTRYPFQANTYGLPEATVADCLAGFLRTIYRPRPSLGRDASFADWSLDRFGTGICRRFMFPYNRKLWSVPPSRMTSDWQGRFVPRPQPSEVLAGALLDQTKGFGYNTAFYYPKRGGSQALVDALAARLRPATLRTGAAVTRVDLAARVAHIQGLGEVHYERLVNTMPLPEFMDISGPWPGPVLAARRRLRHATVWCLNLGLDRPEDTGRHWAYYPERRYPFYRVGVYSNFSSNNAPAGASSYYVEVSRPGGAQVDLRDLERKTLSGLRDCAVLKRGDRLLVKEWMPIPCAYVIHDFARKPAVAAIFKQLGRLGIESIGRYGAWKYSFMEESILDGRQCAKRLCGDAAEEKPA